ncbi:MAG: hypothetical protein QXW12_03935 [Nitrososphaerota archaeon]
MKGVRLFKKWLPAWRGKRKETSSSVVKALKAIKGLKDGKCITEGLGKLKTGTGI